MRKSFSSLLVCLVGLVGCNVEHYDDCNDDDFQFDDDFDGDSSAGKAGHGGSASTTGGNGSGATGADTSQGGTPASAGTSAGGTSGAGEGGSSEPVEPPATPCQVEHDCAPGYNCDLEAHECHAADAETCGELLLEEECTARADCTPIYGGTNCSCGADCECQGGEPGCICESFQFFICQAAE